MSYELEIIKRQLEQIKTLNDYLKKVLKEKGQENLYLILETVTDIFSQISDLKENNNFIITNQNKILEAILLNRKEIESIKKEILQLQDKINKLEEVIKSKKEEKKGLFK